MMVDFVAIDQVELTFPLHSPDSHQILIGYPDTNLPIIEDKMFGMSSTN